MFSIYIDGDSLPKTHRAIVLRRIVKDYIYIKECIFAADRLLPDVRDAIDQHTASLRLPLRDSLDKAELRKIKSNISMVVVETGANSADDKLVEVASSPAFAITHDIPLAARLVEKGIVVLDDRGHELTSENIRARLSERNFMEELRLSGFQNDKTKSFDQRTINEFSNSFDKVFSSYVKNFFDLK